MARTMRRSRTLEILRAGGIVNCFKLNLSDVRAVQIAANAGFDTLWTCMEHIGNTWSTIENQILAAKANDVDMLVRIARGSYSDYIKPLELDASGIMVPHVMSPEDAASVVGMTRFPPLGRRAVDGGNTDAAFCAVPFTDYLIQANRERFIILQIEDPIALENLDGIADVEGFDMLFFGPGDFSCALGFPGQTNHPEVRAARKKVAESASRHGKFAGTVGTIANRQELIDEGYTFISIGADVVGLGAYCAGIADACGAKASDRPVSLYEGTHGRT